MSENSRSSWEFSKSQVSARGGMVVAGKPEAARAGARMLDEGGNAVDAAVAAGWAVAVVEPWMNGIGGAGAMVVHQAGKQTAIDFGARAPRAAGPDTFALDPGGGTGAFGWPAVSGQANEIGHLAAGVPGLVAGLSLAHERFGRLPREVVMQPAIELAESGFEADWHTALIIGLNLEQLIRQPATARIFLREGAFPPRPESRFAKADRIRQTDLADCLRRISARGPSEFYSGELASAIAENVAGHGGLITENDLRDYEPHVYEGGLRGSYRGFDVIGVPSTGGEVLKEILEHLGRHDLASAGTGSAETLDHIADACRCAFADYFAQPASAASHTTHLCVVDRDRNAASITQTLGLMFGSFATVPGTGIVLNNLMSVFDPRPTQAQSMQSGASPVAAYAPTVLLRSGALYAALGAPGGRRIPTAVAQVISNLVDHGMGVQEAVAAPRIHSESALLEADDRFPRETLDDLRRRGHEVIAQEKTFVSFNFATPVAIVVSNDGGLAGGTDPMAPSAVVAVG